METAMNFKAPPLTLTSSPAPAPAPAHVVAMDLRCKNWNLDHRFGIEGQTPNKILLHRIDASFGVVVVIVYRFDWKNLLAVWPNIDFSDRLLVDLHHINSTR
mmetsp:Transcript_10493/g.28161  ORF Transcript_10493/g.28161 Transcript_10493/m.28161 type:complete len:102 (+) Transcript_10493:775-1080(+)